MSQIQVYNGLDHRNIGAVLGKRKWLGGGYLATIRILCLQDEFEIHPVTPKMLRLLAYKLKNIAKDLENKTKSSEESHYEG